jgi:hypothetical protein
MGEIYEVRSAVEHLHEDRYLDPLSRATQVDLTKKEAITSQIDLVRACASTDRS